MLVEFLHTLAEVERRKVYGDGGYGSLVMFLQRYLGYSNGSAYRRMKGAQLLMRFPVIAPFLEDGRLCLTTLCELREVLTEENVAQVLERAAGKNEDEVKLLARRCGRSPRRRIYCAGFRSVSRRSPAAGVAACRSRAAAPRIEPSPPSSTCCAWPSAASSSPTSRRCAMR